MLKKRGSINTEVRVEENNRIHNMTMLDIGYFFLKNC